MFPSLLVASWHFSDAVIHTIYAHHASLKDKVLSHLWKELAYPLHCDFIHLDDCIQFFT
jgi:hypothetical protein